MWLPAGWLALQAVAFLKTVSLSQDGDEAAAMYSLDCSLGSLPPFTCYSADDNTENQENN